MQEEIKIYEEKMHKSYDALINEYSTIRAGRANPKVLDKLRVDYYGTPTPIQQVANISVPEPRMLQIQPWEKSLIKAIEKAILTSDLGINPNNDGSVIRLVFPELTEERRKELAKDIKKKGENTKVAVRNIRRDANDAFKKKEKAGEISEDDLELGIEKIQKLTDKMIEQIDKAVEAKSKEIRTVEQQGAGNPAPCSGIRRMAAGRPRSGAKARRGVRYRHGRNRYGRVFSAKTCGNHYGRQRPVGEEAGTPADHGPQGRL